MKYTVSVCEGNNTIILQNGTIVPSIILDITIHSLLSADGGNYTCHGTRGESVTQLTIVQGTAPTPPTTTPPPPTTLPLTTDTKQPTLAPNNHNHLLLPTVHVLVSIVTILVIALVLLIIFIAYLLRKIKIKNSLIRSTEAVKVPNSLSIKERGSIYVQDVIYEEIAERSNMLVTNNEAYVCVSTPLEKRTTLN